MHVFYQWVFVVAPALCPSLPLHSQKWRARAPPGYMAPAPLHVPTLRSLCPIIVHRYVILNLLDIRVKFCVESDIGSQDIRENTVHLFKLEVFGGTNGGVLTLETK